MSRVILGLRLLSKNGETAEAARILIPTVQLCTPTNVRKVRFCLAFPLQRFEQIHSKNTLIDRCQESDSECVLSCGLGPVLHTHTMMKSLMKRTSDGLFSTKQDRSDAVIHPSVPAMDEKCPANILTYGTSVKIQDVATVAVPHIPALVSNEPRPLLFFACVLRLQVCRAYCTGLSAAFMAVQYAFECWCSPDGGLDYNRHYDMLGEDAVCDMPCLGDEVRTYIDYSERGC